MTHELHKLMLRYLDGECSPGDHAALTEAMRVDEALRREFVGLCFQRRIMREALTRKGSLEAFIGAPEGRVQDSGFRVQERKSAIRNPQSATLFALAAAIALAVTAWFLFFPNPQPPTPSPSPTTSSSVAMITDQRGARWADAHNAARNGDTLTPGLLELEAGSAQIMLTGGAVVDLHAPVKIQLIDDHHARLHHGQLSAWVPGRAVGFTVDAPGARVVDLGTEFSMEVNTVGDLRLQVMAGRVRLITAVDSRLVTAGDAWAVDAAGSMRSIAFVAPSRDPWETATAAWYKLQGDGVDASDHELNLQAAVSPFAAPGAAPTFAHDGTRQLRRSMMPEGLDHFNTDQFTIEAWVRDPSLADIDQDHNGIFAYRNGNAGRFQFTVLGGKTGGHAGSLRLDYNRADTDSFYGGATTGPLTWTPGVWYHVAVVFEAGSPASGDGVIRFYRTALGGATELLATLRDQPEMTPLTAGGSLTLGGFDGSDTRCFDGAIASVRYINHPLDARQIADLAASPPSTARPDTFIPQGDL